MAASINKEQTSKEFYEKRYQEGYMEEWDENKKLKVRDVLRKIELPKNGKALDFGCGNGVFTIILKEELPDWEIFGVEISEVAVKNAKEKFPNCTFLTIQDAASLSHQFDFIFSHHVLEHVDDLTETFKIIDNYLKPESFQLHVLPCGNKGSYEYEICALKKNGIESDKGNRFFFEEPGHLRRVTSEEFIAHEKQIGFSLVSSFFSNQYYGAINWITKSSPRFVKKLTDETDAISEEAKGKLKKLRAKLLPLTYLQFPYSKYLLIKQKWHKSTIDKLMLAALTVPTLISKNYYQKFDNKAQQEWEQQKEKPNGSEMFLLFKRNNK